MKQLDVKKCYGNIMPAKKLCESLATSQWLLSAHQHLLQSEVTGCQRQVLRKWMKIIFSNLFVNDPNSQRHCFQNFRSSMPPSSPGGGPRRNPPPVNRQPPAPAPPRAAPSAPPGRGPPPPPGRSGGGGLPPPMIPT